MLWSNMTCLDRKVILDTDVKETKTNEMKDTTDFAENKKTLDGKNRD